MTGRCPECDGILELVTDGAVSVLIAPSFFVAGRSELRREQQLRPFIACSQCEHCEEVPTMRRQLDATATNGGKVTIETMQPEMTIADAFAHLPRQPRQKRKRGYSTAFRPRGKGKRYTLDAIPSTLWRDVRAKAQREGVSIRALMLSLLEDWSTPATEQRGQQ